MALTVNWDRLHGARNPNSGRRRQPRREAYKQYLKSRHWDVLRTVVMERDGNQCQDCGSTFRLQVHHRRYERNWKDASQADLITLCRRCHLKRHPAKKGPTTWTQKLAVLWSRKTVALSNEDRTLVEKIEQFGIRREQRLARRILDHDDICFRHKNPGQSLIHNPAVRPRGYARPDLQQHKDESKELNTDDRSMSLKTNPSPPAHPAPIGQSEIHGRAQGPLASTEAGCQPHPISCLRA